MTRHFWCFITFLGLLSSCGGGDDSPAAPGAAQLVFPLQNSECTTGESLSEELSQVTFEWGASSNTESYLLSAVNLNTNSAQTITTTSTSASLSINKGTPYSWTVTSINPNSGQTVSEVWLFYNAGSQTTYPPFPAQLVRPVSGSTVQKSVSNEVILEWIGADVENDIVSYEVFFSDQNPPLTSEANLDGLTRELAVSVQSNTIYYWRVVTTDGEGNRSDSGVFEFRVF
nr:hypothetical protein [Allomuricauda sp.]